MKFNFKIQQYQTDAVDAVVRVFQGQGFHDNISYIRDRGKVKAEPYQMTIGLSDKLLEVIDPLDDTGYKNKNVEDNYLIACFDSDVTEETIKATTKQKPYYFVMRDNSIASDSVATNFDQIFASYKPNNVRKVF